MTPRPTKNKWLVQTPNATHMIGLGEEAIRVSLAVSCINIALQRGTENLERWLDKYAR